MVDLFDQVEEELRTEQYKRLAQKALPWAIGLVIVGVIFAAGLIGWSKYQESAQHKAADAYHAALKLGAEGNLPGAEKAFGEIKGSKGYQALGLMQQGGIRLAQNRTKEAVEAFDAAAEAAPGGKIGYILSDAARLKSALALLDDAPYAQIEERVKPLTEDERPYRAMAREVLAMAKLNAGMLKEARSDFTLLSTSIDATPDINDRARAAIALIDSGSAAAIKPTVQAMKTAQALATPQALPPGLTAPAAAPAAGAAK